MGNCLSLRLISLFSLEHLGYDDLPVEVDEGETIESKLIESQS